MEHRVLVKHRVRSWPPLLLRLQTLPLCHRHAVGGDEGRAVRAHRRAAVVPAGKGVAGALGRGQSAGEMRP